MDGTSKVIRIEDNKRAGYGATHVRTVVDLFVRSDESIVPALVSETAFFSVGQPPSARAKFVQLPPPLVDAILRALANAAPGSAMKPGQVIVEPSDTYWRTEVRVRSDDEAHEATVMNATNGRSPRGWSWRACEHDVEIEPMPLEDAVRALLRQAGSP